MPEALVNLRLVIVAEAERRSSAVNAPLMVEMVDEVDLNPLLVSSPLIREIVAEVDLKLFDMTCPKLDDPPRFSVAPVRPILTILALVVPMLIVYVEVASIRPPDGI